MCCQEILVGSTGVLTWATQIRVTLQRVIVMGHDGDDEVSGSEKVRLVDVLSRPFVLVLLGYRLSNAAYMDERVLGCGVVFIYAVLERIPNLLLCPIYAVQNVA